MRRLPDGAPILTAAAMRAAESAAFAGGVTPSELMRRAGVAVAVQVARLSAGRPVLVLAGPGSNGGDARIAADWLIERGHDVTCVAVDGLTSAEPRAVLIDGLFGTGLSRALDPALSADLKRLRAAADLTIAIDLPSGVATDDGSDLGGAGADVTIALGAVKPGHLLEAGIGMSGHVLLAELGIAIASDWRTLSRPVLQPPGVEDHKFSRGMVAVLAGAMPGAARLAARAAMRGGAGYVVLAGEDGGGPDALVHRAGDVALLDDARIGAVLVGPGLGRDHAARVSLDRALASDRPLVIDGDALSILGAGVADRLQGRHAILTPHSGEFDRMFGRGDGSKIDRTLAAARASGCTIVHKGADTVIATPDGRVTVASAASSWLASAGTGDVLAGLVAARLAAGGRDPAAEAVWFHARAAALAGPALIADDLIEQISIALVECLQTIP
ncbi:MAG: NAD(P)H-hydrate dehydratase [Pseudomonadota bacterium]